ncbi:flagellar hook-length control protein FliK [Algicella marina]|nr:flagellar hook-length control protein FliK [Algicella marina]
MTPLEVITNSTQPVKGADGKASAKLALSGGFGKGDGDGFEDAIKTAEMELKLKVRGADAPEAELLPPKPRAFPVTDVLPADSDVAVKETVGGSQEPELPDKEVDGPALEMVRIDMPSPETRQTPVPTGQMAPDGVVQTVDTPVQVRQQATAQDDDSPTADVRPEVRQTVSENELPVQKEAALARSVPVSTVPGADVSASFTETETALQSAAQPRPEVQTDTAVKDFGRKPPADQTPAQAISSPPAAKVGHGRPREETPVADQSERVEATVKETGVQLKKGSSATQGATLAPLEAKAANVVLSELPGTGLMEDTIGREQMSVIRAQEGVVSQISRSHGIALQILQQVLPQLGVVTQRNGGDGNVEIRLDPPELGKVRISMSGNEASLTANVFVERAEVEALLRRNADVLHSALSEAGFDGLSLNFGGAAEDLPDSNIADAETGGSVKAADIEPLSLHLTLGRQAVGEGRLDIRL